MLPLLYARTLWETITLSQDSHIPEHLQEEFTARGAAELARATLALAQSGGMPPEEQREAGVEAIMLARRALEIRIQLYGADGGEVADVTGVLADILGYFNDADDDEEVPLLYEQSKAIYARVQGSLSPNVASSEYNLGTVYQRRAIRARAAHDLDGCVANLELSLPRFREAARIKRAINHLDQADEAARIVIETEEKLRQIVALRATLG